MLLQQQEALLNGLILLGLTNLGAIGVLIYKIGRYTGTTDERISGIENKLSGVESDLKMHFSYDANVDKEIHETQIKHGESLARVETECQSMQRDLMILRDRQHAMANTMTAISMKIGLEVPMHPASD